MSAANAGEVLARHYHTGEPVRMAWEAGRLVSIQAAATAPAELWVAPPLMDLQINGYGGVDFQQDNVSLEELVLAAKKLQAAGCTRWFLTLVTDEWARMMARLRQLQEVRSRSVFLQEAIAGWHIEGPFLSPEPGFCGAHNRTVMCDPKPEALEELRSITGDTPVLLTLASERTGAIAAISKARELGMRVSLGHTNASAEMIAQAIQAGATGFTHLGNGCPGALDRHDNILWRVLDLANAGSSEQKQPKPGCAPLTVSLIPDRIHVSPVLFRLVHRVFGGGSIYYTTDAMAAAGASPGRYRLGPMELEVGPDQIVRMPGQTNYAGSALRPVEGVFRAAAMLGCSWQEPWRRFSEVPAQFSGLNFGLKVGHPATFCVLKVYPPNELISLSVYRNGIQI